MTWRDGKLGRPGVAATRLGGRAGWVHRRWRALSAMKRQNFGIVKLL
jgi:hypothetical protein